MNKPDAKEYIKRRYLFPLIIVFSLLVILIGYKYYKYEERVIIKNKSEELKAIGELKENQIKKWREERLNDITNISQSRLFSRRLEEYLRNPSDSESGKDILDRIKLFRNTYNYGNTCITNREGKILLSASDSITAIDPIFIPDIIKSAETKTFLMGDFNFCPSRNEILIMTASPVLNSENEVIAVLVLESNPYEFLYPYVQNWPTDSKTAETIILRKEGDSVLYLNELRHQKNTALKLKFPLSQLHMPEVKTIKEEQGVSEGIDYRGEEVLAYYSKIDNSPWYLVSKIDRKEILSELKFRGIFIIIIACLLILFSLTSAAYIYNQRQKYIYKSLFEKETELQKSQQEFRTILYSIGDGVISTDKNGIVQVLNPVAERLTGWSEKEALGRKLDEVFQVIDSDTRKKIENPVKQVLNKGLITGFAEHSLLISRSGAEYPIADAGSPVKDDDGNTIGVVIVFSDRTEERKELNNLRESEDWFKYIFESANAGKSITFLSGELNANKYFCKMLGYSPGELKNKKWQDITHTEDIEFIQKQTERLLIGEKESIRFEKRYIHKNGSIVWADVSVTLRRDKEGKPLHFITTLIDITSRKEAEEELRNSEERFRTLFETMEQGVVYQNCDGKITMANPAAERILGLTMKQMQGLTSSDPNWRAIKEDGSEYPGNEHPSMTALKTGKPVTGNLMGVYNHKNGNYRWILINATPLFRNGEENPYQVYTVFTDITESKKREEEHRKNEHRQKKYANLLSELINRGEFLSGNLKENLMNITEIASIMLDTERVGIRRYSEDYSLLHCYDLFESGKNKHSEGYKLNSSEFPDYTQSHKIGEVIAAEDVFTDSRTSHIPAEYFKSNGIKSLLDAPVWVEGKLTAVLSFEQTGERRKWLPEEIQISLTLSSYVSMCIESYERKKIEKAIASSEANLKEAQRIAKLGRWELDLVNDKLEWTDSIYEIFELGKKEFGATYEAFLDAVHPEDRNAVNTAYRKSLADKTPYEITHRLLMKDGRIKWVKEICRSEFDNEGMPLRSIGIVQDITDIMTAEKSLRESEEKFRTFVETMPEGYYQSTPSGKFIYVNPALAKLLGYEDREELMKVDIPSQLYFKPEEREVLYKNVDFTGDFEIYRLKRKDSTEVWIEDHSRYIRDEKGKVKYHEGICRDITKRLEYEDRIRKLNRVYAVLSSINQTIVRTHDIKELFDEVCRIAVDEGKFRMAFIGIKNTKEQKIDIVSRHGYINGYFDNTVLSINEDSEPVGPSAITIINGENIICNDIENDMLMKRWKKEALKRKYYSKASFPLKVFGKIYGVISIYSDIRNFFDKDEIELLDDLSRDISFAIESIYNEEVRRNAETELIKAKEKAEEMNRVKTNFLANMSHEIRTPMVAILGFSEYMAETAKEKDLRESAEKVYEGGKRLMETLDMILNISLIESQKVNIELTDVDIIKEIREATSFFEITAKNKNLYLKTETEFENLYLRLDSRIFRHILNNLINNGVKYSGTGGITIKVTKEKRNKEKYAVIRVIDTGIGIPADKQDLIWEEFRQVSEGWGRQFEGSGLGLAITKQFVQKLGGEIYVEKSIPGKGSTFMMLFHYDESIQERLKSEKIKTSEIPADIPVSEPDDSLPEILYVENEEDSISLVKLILRNVCKIDTAYTGEEAIMKVSIKKYPAVIMDINLGKGIDGLRVTEIIKKIPGYEGTPVIALTAYAMAEEKKEFLSKGCTHYVSKPFRKNEFVKLISQVLKKGQV